MENMFVGILVSGACGCAAPPAERFMLIAESERVHLHGVVTRDVVHVNSRVREGSPSRRSYKGCATIVYPTSKTVSAIWPKCMGVHSLIWLSCTKSIRLL